VFAYNLQRMTVVNRWDSTLPARLQLIQDASRPLADAALAASAV